MINVISGTSQVKICERNPFLKFDAYESKRWAIKRGSNNLNDSPVISHHHE